MGQGESGAVVVIHRGRVRFGTTRSRLPRTSRGSRFTPGVLPQREATLAALQAIATRCVPWVRVYVGPRLWSVAGPEDDYACRAVVQRLVPAQRAARWLARASAATASLAFQWPLPLVWAMAGLLTALAAR